MGLSGVGTFQDWITFKLKAFSILETSANLAESLAFEAYHLKKTNATVASIASIVITIISSTSVNHFICCFFI